MELPRGRTASLRLSCWLPRGGPGRATPGPATWEAAQPHPTSSFPALPAWRGSRDKGEVPQPLKPQAPA